MRDNVPIENKQDFLILHAEATKPSRRLERIASVLKTGRTHTVGDIVDRFGRSGFGFIILLLALPAMIPIPGPFGVVFGLCLALVSLQVLGGAAKLWLPRRMREKRVDGGFLKSGIGHAASWLRWTEKWVRPRREPLWLLRHLRPIVGVPVLVLALIIAIPIPLGNIMPCLALLFVALGLIAEDGLALAGGLAIGIAAVAWTVFLFVAGGNLAGSVLTMAGWS